jgi:hypothetical protein
LSTRIVTPLFEIVPAVLVSGSFTPSPRSKLSTVESMKKTINRNSTSTSS